MIGRIPPTPGLVDQFFNTSTGHGEDGEIDARGPWNEGGDFQFVEAPAFQSLSGTNGGAAATGVDDRTTSTSSNPDIVEALLAEQLRDLLHAEGQLVKALPKMVKAAHNDALRFAFENHLEETGPHRRGAEGGALRDLGLWHRSNDGRASGAAGSGRTAEQVAS
jgi:Mn-containing catalase